MPTNYFTRVYFSRYFFFAYRSSLAKYSRISTLSSLANKDIYFFSDPYVFNRARSMKHETSVSFSGAAPARSFFFGLKFYFNNKVYDYSWQKFKNDEEFFKKFFIIFMRAHLRFVASHQYSVFTIAQFFRSYFFKNLW